MPNSADTLSNPDIVQTLELKAANPTVNPQDALATGVEQNFGNTSKAFNLLEEIQAPYSPSLNKDGLPTQVTDLAGGSTDKTHTIESSTPSILNVRATELADPDAVRADAIKIQQTVKSYPDLRSNPTYEQMRAEARSQWNQNNPGQQISEEYSKILDEITEDKFRKRNPDLSDAYDAAAAEKAKQAAQQKKVEAPPAANPTVPVA